MSFEQTVYIVIMYKSYHFRSQPLTVPIRPDRPVSWSHAILPRGTEQRSKYCTFHLYSTSSIVLLSDS